MLIRGKLYVKIKDWRAGNSEQDLSCFTIYDPPFRGAKCYCYPRFDSDRYHNAFTMIKGKLRTIMFVY